MARTGAGKRKRSRNHRPMITHPPQAAKDRKKRPACSQAARRSLLKSAVAKVVRAALIKPDKVVRLCKSSFQSPGKYFGCVRFAEKATDCAKMSVKLAGNRAVPIQ